MLISTSSLNSISYCDVYGSNMNRSRVKWLLASDRRVIRTLVILSGVWPEQRMDRQSLIIAYDCRRGVLR